METSAFHEPQRHAVQQITSRFNTIWVNSQIQTLRPCVETDVSFYSIQGVLAPHTRNPLRINDLLKVSREHTADSLEPAFTSLFSDRARISQLPLFLPAYCTIIRRPEGTTNNSPRAGTYAVDQGLSALPNHTMGV